MRQCCGSRFNPPVTVLPGDEIQVECRFDTTDRTDFIYFGNNVDPYNDRGIIVKQVLATKHLHAGTVTVRGRRFGDK